ncbi:Ephrin type-B receptor 2 [Labeo rohita]|uniref:Ephrin type-B receptor 2 n=1 Tax=Labeo rohita TaxID=84645 RepID=A0ABQ8M8E3_LABRO|nr:Ephrin type-B receptor 2 [Labeo rohita]
MYADGRNLQKHKHHCSQHSTNLGFMVVWQDSVLFSMKTHENPLGICKKKHPKDLQTVRDKILWSDVPQFQASCLKETRHCSSPAEYHRKTCPSGFFKTAQGDEKCLQCPINSRTTNNGATNCVCRNGYYRTDSDPLEMPCTSAFFLLCLNLHEKPTFKLYFPIRQRKQTCSPIIETDETVKTKRERQTAPYAVVSGMFLSPPERGEVGAEKKEKEKEERDSFFTKAICKSLALGGEQLLAKASGLLLDYLTCPRGAPRVIGSTCRLQINTGYSVPSAPQNVISSVNETSLMLEWNPPRETGGRDDVVYNIICKSCGGGRGGCTRCGDNVQFVPRQLGLTDTRVFISDLLAHTQYTFEVQAVNGVSDQSPYSPQYASVNITTNQAEWYWELLGAQTETAIILCSSSLLATDRSSNPSPLYPRKAPCFSQPRTSIRGSCESTHSSSLLADRAPWDRALGLRGLGQAVRAFNFVWIGGLWGYINILSPLISKGGFELPPPRFVPAVVCVHGFVRIHEVSPQLLLSSSPRPFHTVRHNLSHNTFEARLK